MATFLRRDQKARTPPPFRGHPRSRVGTATMSALERHLRNLAFVVAAPLLGCSSGDEGADSRLGSGGRGGSGGSTIVDPNASGGSGSSVASGGSAASGSDDCGTSVLNGCVGEFYEGESLPPDIYIMFDQ